MTSQKHSFNGKSYHVKNISIKSYSGNTLLGSTPTTLFKECVMPLFPLTKSRTRTSGQCKETISLSEFKFVDQLNIIIHYLPNKNMQHKKCHRKKHCAVFTFRSKECNKEYHCKTLCSVNSGIFKQEELN